MPSVCLSRAGCRKFVRHRKETAVNFVWFLLIGLAAGWLAGQLMKGSGFGVVGDIVVGVIGALLGGGI